MGSADLVRRRRGRPPTLQVDRRQAPTSQLATPCRRHWLPSPEVATIVWASAWTLELGPASTSCVVPKQRRPIPQRRGKPLRQGQITRIPVLVQSLGWAAVEVGAERGAAAIRGRPSLGGRYQPVGVGGRSCRVTGSAA